MPSFDLSKPPVNVIDMIKQSRMGKSSSTEAKKDAAADFSAVLKQIGTVKLRTVQRYAMPNGTFISCDLCLLK